MKSLKMMIGICVLLIIMISIAGCIGSDEDTEEPEGDMQLKITVLRAEEKLEDLDGYEPSEGYCYLYLKIKIENLNEDKNYDLEWMAYQVETDAGERQCELAFDDDYPEFIGAGDTVTFYGVYELPDDEKGKILHCECFETPGFLEEVSIPSY